MDCDILPKILFNWKGVQSNYFLCVLLLVGFFYFKSPRPEMEGVGQVDMNGLGTPQLSALLGK